MADHKYRFTYSFEPHPDGILSDDIPNGHGACDAIVLGSIIYPEDGSLSTMVLSSDGRTGKDLDDNEIFKFWTVLAKQLSESKQLSEGKLALCIDVFRTVQKAILQHRSAVEDAVLRKEGE